MASNRNSINPVNYQIKKIKPTIERPHALIQIIYDGQKQPEYYQWKNYHNEPDLSTIIPKPVTLKGYGSILFFKAPQNMSKQTLSKLNHQNYQLSPTAWKLPDHPNIVPRLEKIVEEVDEVTKLGYLYSKNQ